MIIKKSTQNIGEDSRSNIKAVWQSCHQIPTKPCKSFSNSHITMSNEQCEVVDIMAGGVELLDSDGVGVSEAYQDVEDIHSVFPGSKEQDVIQGLKRGDFYGAFFGDHRQKQGPP